MTAQTDKLDSHHQQQLSALMDGDLVIDQARFLLRRLQHDGELLASWERWHLCGDALRGQAQAPAPAGFAERVAQAIADESADRRDSAPPAAVARHSRLSRWGGGALAASVALVALLMVRQSNPPQEIAPAGPVVAAQSTQADSVDTTVADAANAAPVTPTVPADPAGDPLTDTLAGAAAASVAVASVPRRQDGNNRGSATRTQQAARRAARANLPQTAVAAASVAPRMQADSAVAATVAAPTSILPVSPFAGAHLADPQSRPWPRTSLSQSSGGAFTASYDSDGGARTFYPFEPRLSQVEATAGSDTDSGQGPGD
ncbi:sigma-E factor negative regulatory protein [Pseudoxanthomonas dokdonensis]|uniref:Anti sigma-E protein RseA N-terminal domain-containing protein n=1 Tax=Pseudoxanthomonas dokdonensis TaxID=344882 RepID=A0A0R0CYD3_9GAMM|nr:sigma-E factor negative regulatory protein [Pseudoxanthomonas dokdonensis]KRG70865.1 hypothetical protein ABB29_03200 [Pseudoxanthomonas dokdonensis]